MIFMKTLWVFLFIMSKNLNKKISVKLIKYISFCLAISAQSQDINITVQSRWFVGVTRQQLVEGSGQIGKNMPHLTVTVAASLQLIFAIYIYFFIKKLPFLDFIHQLIKKPMTPPGTLPSLHPLQPPADIPRLSWIQSAPGLYLA